MSTKDNMSMPDSDYLPVVDYEIKKYMDDIRNGPFTVEKEMSNVNILTDIEDTVIKNPELIKAIVEGPRILDSGDRTEFSTGAVRDMREGKGRCDLLPLDVVVDYLDGVQVNGFDVVLKRINDFMNTNNVSKLYYALDVFTEGLWDNNYTMFLEVAKHFEEGAKKYGDNNWRKGIPVRCYIDSAVRHYLKFLRGDMDEPHDRAFCWNILCCIWTCKHMPELNDYAKKEGESDAV